MSDLRGRSLKDRARSTDAGPDREMRGRPEWARPADYAKYEPVLGDQEWAFFDCCSP